jgi:DnaJ-class molecular chaperone
MSKHSNLSTEDAYIILGLRPGTNHEDIKSQYHRMLLKWHPDRNSDPEASKKFQEIEQAYQKILSSPNNPKTFQYTSVDDLMKMLGNISNAVTAPIERTIYLDLEDIYNGTVSYQTIEIGKSSKTIKVDIPPGCLDPIKVRLGQQSYLFHVKSKIHPHYEQRGYDLYLRRIVSVEEYVSGFEVIFQLLNGSKKRLTHKGNPGGVVGSESKPWRLDGLGMPKGHSGKYGDLYIIVSVRMPMTSSNECL